MVFLRFHRTNNNTTQNHAFLLMAWHKVILNRPSQMGISLYICWPLKVNSYLDNHISVNQPLYLYQFQFHNYLTRLYEIPHAICSFPMRHRPFHNKIYFIIIPYNYLGNLAHNKTIQDYKNFKDILELQ